MILAVNTCRRCGQEIIVRKNKARDWHRAGYCTAKCGVMDGRVDWKRHVGGRGRKSDPSTWKRRCKHCGVPINCKRAYCSDACRDQATEERRAQAFQRRMEECGVACSVCGKMFIPLRKTDDGMCSNSCRITRRQREYETEQSRTCDMCGRILTDNHQLSVHRCYACCVFYGRPAQPFAHHGIIDAAIEDAELMLNDQKAFDEKFGIKE